MEVYANKAQAVQAEAFSTDPANFLATPGINVFTQDVNVTPGWSFDMSTAFVFTSASGFQGEVGFNRYCRRQECVTLACQWVEGPALKCDLGNGATSRFRDIRPEATLTNLCNPLNPENGSPSYETNIIKESDLDLASAAHPSVLAHIVHASIGKRWDEREYPVHLHAGGSYETGSESNAVLSRWTIWGKFGFAF